MKKLMLAAFLMFGGATLVSAQEQPQQTAPGQTQTDQQQEGQQIAASELPESITAKLESEDYSGWTVGNAYKKMDENNMEIYVVEMRQGTETKKVKFDRDCNKLEHDKDKKADHQEAQQEPQEQP